MIVIKNLTFPTGNLRTDMSVCTTQVLLSDGMRSHVAKFSSGVRRPHPEQDGRVLGAVQEHAHRSDVDAGRATAHGRKLLLGFSLPHF